MEYAQVNANFQDNLNYSKGAIFVPWFNNVAEVEIVKV